MKMFINVITILLRKMPLFIKQIKDNTKKLTLYYYKNLTNFFSYFSIFILFFSIALLNCDFFVSCEDIDPKDQNCAVETQKEPVSKYKLIAIFIVATFIGFYFTGEYFNTFPFADRGPDSPK